MIEIELKRIFETLSEGKNNYYVYTLRDENNIPFYVGKGCGNRVIQHNKEAMTVKSLLNNDEEINDIAKEKIKKLIKLDNNFDFYHIEKYGLSENEAFMCESILINYIESTGIKLTNIVNGHASESEKKSVANTKTKSRSLPEFLNEVAISQVDIVDIKENILFIKINNSYSDCKNSDLNIFKQNIKQVTSGCWKLSIDRIKKNNIKYVISLYNQKVVGIYTIEYISKSLDEEYKLTKLANLPGYPIGSRLIDIWIAKFDNIEQAEKELNTNDYNIFYNNLLNRSDNDITKMNEYIKEYKTRKYLKLNENNVPFDLLKLYNCIIVNSKDNKFFKQENPIRYWEPNKSIKK